MTIAVRILKWFRDWVKKTVGLTKRGFIDQIVAKMEGQDALAILIASRDRRDKRSEGQEIGA